MKIITWLLIFSFASSFSQNDSLKSNDEISNSVANYFSLDRETIHLHLNKNTYLTDEKIWFKGYIIEKKSKLPFFATTNVFINLLDEKETVISSQLYFAENSTFNGYYSLNSKLKSGRYYLQAFTNFMNNFSEDESTIIPIQVANTEDNNFTDFNVINYEKLLVNIIPESDVLLDGISNTVGVKISDCHNNGIAVQDIEVLNSKNEKIVTLSTNKKGHSRFELTPKNGEKYRISFIVNNQKIEKELPLSSSNGIKLSVNNFTLKDKTSIKIQTNTINNENIINSTLLIQQNNTITYLPIIFEKNQTEKNIILPNNYFNNGVNTIRLLNAEKKQIAERNIYNYFSIPNKLELNVTRKNKDSITFNGVSDMPLSNLSISVLPSSTLSENPEKTILNTFLIESDLLDEIRNISYYLKDVTRAKQFELDNLMLFQKSKYDFASILKNPPIKKHQFDAGITIKGSINNTLTPNKKYKINMTAYTIGLNESTDVNTKKEFVFDHVYAVDSTSIHFSLLNQNDKTTELNVYTQLLNNKRKFNKTFVPKYEYCNIDNSNLLSDIPFPVIANSILLDNITIKKTIVKQELLSNTKKYNNSVAKGYKIDATAAATFNDLFGFIQSHGFTVITNGAQVNITRLGATSFQGDNSPTVFLDDIPITDFTQLQYYSLQNIDEIYISRFGYGAGSAGANGTIRIYTKIPAGNQNSTIKIKSKPFLVDNGFQAYKEYKNPEYTNFQDQSFLTFGSIHWIPNVNTSQEGTFKFSIPNLNQESIMLVIEGISSDGLLISETKTIQIN